MAAKILRSLAVSAFCEDMAMMLAAGIQVDDALSLMRGDSGDGPLYDAASAVLERVQMGEPLAEAVEQCGYFPAYAAQLVAAGEAAGRTESVLKSLAVYYETQDKLEKRLKSAVIYPAVLLFLMAGVLAVLVARVLPVFTGVYTGLAGSVAASSYAYITAANIIGWASLCLVIVLTALLLTGAAAARTQRGNGLFRTLFEKLPLLLLLPGGWRRRNLLRRWPRLRPAGWTPTQQWNARRTWCGTARCARSWKAAAGRCLRGAAWRRPFTITVCSNRCTRAC